MRTFVISDIHGNNAAFKKALKEINLTKNDRLIVLGDLIDRGDDSKGVLDTIFSLIESGIDITCLMGNHERMMLDAGFSSKTLNQWLANGGTKTLLSFQANSINDIPAKYFELIRSFLYFLETENFVYVHAAVNMKIANPSLDVYTLLWERNPFRFFNEKWLGKRKVIYGHTPHARMEIIHTTNNNEQFICIDNGSFAQIPGYGSICVLQQEPLEVYFFD